MFLLAATSLRALDQCCACAALNLLHDLLFGLFISSSPLIFQAELGDFMGVSGRTKEHYPLTGFNTDEHKYILKILSL